MPPGSEQKPVVIIGGGWAGIAAAIHLSLHQQAVVLIESANQLGGRARMVMFGDVPVDNGQHIVLGAYRHLLELFRIIGLDEKMVLSRQPLSLYVNGDQGTVVLKAPKIPAPFHLLLAFVKAQGLNVSEKSTTIFNWLRLIGHRAEADMTVSELLQQTGQSEKVSHYLWGPLCIAALNTLPQKSSARLFQRVLKDSFMRRRADSDILLPRFDMGRVLPQPAQTWLQQRGVSLLTGKRVSSLLTEDDRIIGVQVGDETIESDRVIIATNPWGCASLTQSIPALRAIGEKLDQLEYEPITTVYLKYKKSVLLNPTMQGFVDTTIQWLFDRRMTSHPKILAAVISADGEHAGLGKDELVNLVIAEIKANTHLQEDPLDSLVIREKRATFSATPAAEKLRPKNQTPLKGCWIAGDYTDTGYPATLEGAIISGKRCATQILKGTPA